MKGIEKNLYKTTLSQKKEDRAPSGIEAANNNGLLRDEVARIQWRFGGTRLPVAVVIEPLLRGCGDKSGPLSRGRARNDKANERTSEKATDAGASQGN